MSGDDWDWKIGGRDSGVIFPSVSAVAVYRNPSGEIVIRQEDTMGEDDACIIVPLSLLPVLIDALQRELAASEEPPEPESPY